MSDPVITIPSPDDDNVLRHVRLDDEHTLITWDTNRIDRTHGPKYLIGYALRRKDAVIFCGEDMACSPMDAIDSDAALRSLLCFLTLRDGDTDSEYFDSYSEAQIAWRDECAEGLSLWALDGDSDMPAMDFADA